MDAPLVPAHGAGAFVDVVPSLLAGLGVAGFADRLGLYPAPAIGSRLQHHPLSLARPVAVIGD